MGKVTNAAVRARAMARARRLGLEVDRQARDERIDAATAEVIMAAEQIGAAAQSRDAAVGQARAVFNAAVGAADAAAAEVVAGAELRIGRALRAMIADKLTGARIAELTELSPGDLRRLSRIGVPARPAGEPAAPAATSR